MFWFLFNVWKDKDVVDMFSGFLIKISIIRDIFTSVTGEKEVTGGRWIQTNSNGLGRR